MVHNDQVKKRNSNVYYANNAQQCHWLLNNKKDRCKREVANGKNLCVLHERIKEQEKKHHKEMLRLKQPQLKQHHLKHHLKQPQLKHHLKQHQLKQHHLKQPQLKHHLKQPQLKQTKSGGAMNGTKIYDYNYYLDDEIEPFDSNASLVVPNVWIGSIDSAHDADFLRSKGIKSIVNISGMEPTPHAHEMYRKMGVNYNTLSKVELMPNKQIYTVTDYLGDEKFQKTTLTPREFFNYMSRGVQILNQPDFQFPVLIHCFAGMNRSAALIAAYLLTKPHPYSYEKTLELLRRANERRGLHVLTNKDFKRSLKYFPIFMGKEKNIHPITLSRYNQYLKSYEL